MERNSLTVTASPLSTEQQEMHRIFHLFEHYVTTHPAFTIHFFPRIGYLWLLYDGAENGYVDNRVFHTADEMLHAIIGDIIMDISSRNTPEHIDNQLSEHEKNQIRHLLEEITRDFPQQDKDQCFALLEREMEDPP